MSKLTNTEIIRIPAIKVITIPDNRVIHIDDQIFGKLVVKLLNDDGHDFVEGCEIKMPDYSGEYGCFITVPKAWVNKKVLVKYEREVEAKLIKISPESWFKGLAYFPSHVHIDGLKIDYAPDNKEFSYTISFKE